MQDWFKKWFSSDEYLTVYSHRNEKDAENLINLVLENTDLNNNSKILDAACGAGRHSIILAKLGYNVTAFDLSKNLLRIGKENAEELGVKVDFLCADIRSAFFKTSFDLVLNMFTSFGYFESDSENFSLFLNAKKFTNKNALIVLDYLNENYIRQNLVPASERIIDDKRIVEQRLLKDNRIIKEITIESGGSEYNYYEAVKLYTKNKLVDVFKRLGYKVETVYGDYKGNEFNINESERLILFFRI